MHNDMADLTKDASRFVSGIVQYLATDKQTSGQVPKIRKLLSKVTADNGKDIEAQVVTAIALKSDEKQKLTEALGKLVGHPVSLACSVDQSIIAGMRIKIGDWIVDTSYVHQIDQLAHVLGA